MHDSKLKLIKPQPREVDDVEAAERALLDRIGRKDAGALDDLYRRYYRRLADFLARIVPLELVDEVVNDTLYVVWTKANDFQGKSKVSTWIFGIAYRKALKQRQREQRHTDCARFDEEYSGMAVPDASIAVAAGARKRLNAR